MRNILLFLALSMAMIAGCGRYGGVNDQLQYQLLLEHNVERRDAGLNDLDLDKNLAEYAQKHAEWMASRSNLQHSAIANVIDFGYSTAGENIAYGQTTESEVVQDWMDSTGHRRNILNRKFTHSGFGYAKSKSGRPYWCAVFGG